ncbi:MAG: sulfatase-like hydrolase/transferase, partial [Dinghuibacter sp.]|nr:sulfatase-like hydrolase/transferase [Dinghuibacter sp.]
MKQKLFTQNNRTLPEKPNLLVIITDEDRGLMHFPPGWEEQHLEAMPRLRKNGITFTNAFCSACMCSPSRATMLTGLFPAQHEVTLTLTENMTYSNEEVTLATKMQKIGRMLQAGGYDGNYIGKWHLAKGADGTFGTLTSEDLLEYGFKGW